MAVIYVTGHVPIYVSIPPRSMLNSGTGLPAALTYPSSGSIRYLGFSDRAMKIAIANVFEPAMADPTGQSNPYDKLYQGQSAQVAVTLSVWNELVLAELDKCVDFTGSKTRGKDNLGDLASLMIQEGHTFHCWLDFTYAVLKGFGALFNMPRGMHFTACNATSWEITAGTTQKKRIFAIDAWPVYSPVDGSRLLFDHTFTSIPLPPAMPPIAASGALS